MKPFTNYPSKLVAARFEQQVYMDALLPSGTHDRSLILTWAGQEPYPTWHPLLRLLVTTNKLEKSSYMTKTVPI